MAHAHDVLGAEVNRHPRVRHILRVVSTVRGAPHQLVWITTIIIRNRAHAGHHQPRRVRVALRRAPAPSADVVQRAALPERRPAVRYVHLLVEHVVRNGERRVGTERKAAWGRRDARVA